MSDRRSYRRLEQGVMTLGGIGLVSWSLSNIVVTVFVPRAGPPSVLELAGVGGIGVLLSCTRALAWLAWRHSSHVSPGRCYECERMIRDHSEADAARCLERRETRLHEAAAYGAQLQEFRPLVRIQGSCPVCDSEHTITVTLTCPTCGTQYRLRPVPVPAPDEPSP